jgi:hypothetical protein
MLMPSTPFASPQVVSRLFAWFRVVDFGVSAGHAVLCAWFDSRQPHQEVAAQQRVAVFGRTIVGEDWRRSPLSLLLAGWTLVWFVVVDPDCLCGALSL